MDRIWLWVIFNLFVFGMLALDLGVFHRKAHVIRLREALIWSTIWTVLALIFNLYILFYWQSISPGSEYTNKQAAIAYLTGYIIERALSIDNLFVFLVIFTYFGIPKKYEYKILFWGIIGALAFRVIFIFSGVALLHAFDWMKYVFGVLLLYTAFKVLVSKDIKVDPDKNPIIRWFKKIYPVSNNMESGKFFILDAGKRMATPLFIALLVVEMTDILFAFDSVPAILAITKDPFIVYSANVFAILGLRALYFAIAGIMGLFAYLHYGLSFVLAFVGVKMMLGKEIIPIVVSLGVVLGVIALSIILSLLLPPKKKVLESETTPTEETKI